MTRVPDNDLIGEDVVSGYEPGIRVVPRPGGALATMMRCTEPGWVELARPDGRRGVWLRVGDDFIEICGGREGDDYEARMEIGQPLTEEVRGVFEDVLDVFRFSKETAFERDTSSVSRQHCRDVSFERARVLARWLFGPSATASHHHVVTRIEVELKEAWHAGRVYSEATSRASEAPDVNGPRQVALFRLRRIEAEATAAGETEVSDELAAILEREVARDEPRQT